MIRRQSHLFAAMRRAGLLKDSDRVGVVLQLDIAPPPVEEWQLTRNATTVLGRLATAGISERVLANNDAEVWWARDRYVSVQIPFGHVRDLVRRERVKAVRPIRLHTPQLREVSAIHELESIDDGPRAPTGRGVLVAVVDSGIDVQHPDFAGRIDPRSRNFVAGSGDNDIEDRSGHGTHVAGIIAGAGKRYRGVAPDANLLICRVFNDKNEAGEGTIAEAIHYAVASGAHVINFSGGFAPVFQGMAWLPPPWVWTAMEFKEEAALRQGAAAGIISVVAAGNYGELGPGTIAMPGISPHAITLGSLSKKRLLSSFSSYGPARRSGQIAEFDMVSGSSAGLEFRPLPKPNMVAVGGEKDTGIISARARNANIEAPSHVGELYTRMDGTSQAAPIAAGLAARIVQILEEDPRFASVTGRRRVKFVRDVMKKACLRHSAMGRKASIGTGLPTWPGIARVLMDLS